MRHGWTALSEKDKGPIFVHFRAMRHAMYRMVGQVIKLRDFS